MKGRQRPFPIMKDHFEPVKDVVDESTRSDSGQLEPPADVDTPCVLVDLSMTFSRGIMVSSLVSHVVVGRGPSRSVAFARRFPSQDVGECTETYVHGGDAPQVASVNDTSDDRFLIRPPGLGVRKRTSGIEGVCG